MSTGLNKNINPQNTNIELCTFSYLQNNINAIKLPSSKWCFSRGNNLFIGFQRVEDNGYVHKRVAVTPDTAYPNCIVEIYVDDKLIPFCQYIKVINIEEFEKLLKSVDEY